MKPLSWIVVLAAFAAVPCLAQSSDRPGPTLEVFAGHAGFLDESAIPHTIVGGSARFYVTPRLGVGPEFVYMRGPRSDRDEVLTGNVTWDVLSVRRDNPRQISPFFVGGYGVLRHTARLTIAANHTVTAGGGVRVRINDRVYGLVDFRLGWEPHYRITGGIGVRLSK